MGCLFSKNSERHGHSNSSKTPAKYHIKNYINSNVNDGALFHESVHTFPVLSVCGMKSNGSQFFSASGDMALLYDWKNDTIIQKYEGTHEDDILAMCSLGEEGMICTSSRDKTLALWGRNGTSLGRLVGHALSVVTCDADRSAPGVSKQIVSGSRDNSTRLWDVERLACTQSSKVLRNVVTQIRWFLGEECFLQVGEDLQIRIWDGRTMQVVQVIPALTHIQTCCDVALDGNRFLTGGKAFDSIEGCSVKIWDRRNLKLIRDYQGHTHCVNSCRFISEDRAISVSNDRTVRLWDLSDHWEKGSNTPCLSSVQIDHNTSGAAMSIDAMSDTRFCIGGFEHFTSVFDIQGDRLSPLMWSGGLAE